MRVAVFSTRSWDREFLDEANASFGHELVYFESRLGPETAALADGFPAVCVFVNDQLDAPVLERLHAGGTRLIALRCAGFNNVDLRRAEQLGLMVVRVPAYSPHAVAEHTVALMLSLDRHIHKAWQRVREGNFDLKGLLGFDLHGKTVGIVGTGRIGTCVARILKGFGCRLLATDIVQSEECLAMGVEYAPLEQLMAESRIVTLHCPLTPQTHHLINADTLAMARPGFMLVNTSRGAVVDTRAAIDALKSGRLGALGMDVYEQEADLFFEDLSDQVIQDDLFERLLTFPNVLVTGHQGFFTEEALEAIARTTLDNIRCFEVGGNCPNAVPPMPVPAGEGRS